MLVHVSELKANGAGVRGGRRWRWGGAGITGPAGREEKEEENGAKEERRREKGRRRGWSIGQMTNCD